jgi:hypothetical protein
MQMMILLQCWMHLTLISTALIRKILLIWIEIQKSKKESTLSFKDLLIIKASNLEISQSFCFRVS